MIRFTLQCPEGHRFESWFRDGAAFDVLSGSGGLACPDCGATEIEKSLMAPPVRPARAASAKTQPQADNESPDRLAPTSESERALAALKAKVESEADYVGMSFASEARAMHDGETPSRPIYGEAKPADAIALMKDGVPVAPLPFTPTRKVN